MTRIAAASANATSVGRLRPGYNYIVSSPLRVWLSARAVGALAACFAGLVLGVEPLSHAARGAPHPAAVHDPVLPLLSATTTSPTAVPPMSTVVPPGATPDEDQTRALRRRLARAGTGQRAAAPAVVRGERAGAGGS